MHLVFKLKSYKTTFGVITQIVATLALVSRPRQGLQGYEPRGSLGVKESVRE